MCWYQQNWHCIKLIINTFRAWCIPQTTQKLLCGVLQFKSCKKKGLKFKSKTLNTQIKTMIIVIWKSLRCAAVHFATRAILRCESRNEWMALLHLGSANAYKYRVRKCVHNDPEMHSLAALLYSACGCDDIYILWVQNWFISKCEKKY